MPPQLTPPVPPGNEIVDFGGAPSSWNVNGVNGPSLVNPPLLSHSAWQLVACSALVSAAVTMSSFLKLVFASAGGFTGNGCVGEYHSPGTLPFGTGRSSTPNSGLPVV